MFLITIRVAKRPHSSKILTQKLQFAYFSVKSKMEGANIDQFTLQTSDDENILSLNTYPGSSLTYVLCCTNIMDIQHVNVPKEYRGKGVAELLVNRALAMADENKLKIRPTCPYVRNTFFARYPELADRYRE